MNTSGDHDRQSAVRQVEERLAIAAVKERAAQVALHEAEAEVSDALEAAREFEVPWTRLSDLTGLTMGQLQWRWHRDDPAHADTKEARREERAKNPRARAATRPGRGPGLSVSDAARQLGVTRRTIYLRIERGELEATKNELGQTRVLLEDNNSS